MKLQFHQYETGRCGEGMVKEWGRRAGSMHIKRKGDPSILRSPSSLCSATLGGLRLVGSKCYFNRH